MLRFDKMTVKAQEALQEAQEIAARHENQSVEPIHLLAALVQQPDGVVPPLLARVGIRSDMLSQEIEREIGRLPKVQGFAQQHLGRALNEVLENSFEEATKFKDEYVSTEHLFLAIAGAERDPAGKLLKKQGASHEAILQALAESAAAIASLPRIRKRHSRPWNNMAATSPIWRDAAKLDPVIGRDEEIRRVMQILARRTKNNPGAYWRARRRQDRNRRRAGSANRCRRRAGSAEAEAHWSRWTLQRWWPGRNSAANLKTA